MLRLRRIWFVLLAMTSLLFTPSCVELTGQRISWRFDRALDQLRFLIFYDGIHDSWGTGDTRKFIENGDIMFVTFYIDMGELRSGMARSDVGSEDKDAGRLFLRLDVQHIGYYVEPDGRIGVAQLVTVPRATQFMRELNRLINQAVVRSTAAYWHEIFPKTAQRLKSAAARGHRWITLNGHSIRMDFPVQAEEWPYLKGFLWKDFVDDIGSSTDADTLLRQSISSISLSYIESRNQVTLVMGRSDFPNTLRVSISNDYEPNAESDVKETMKTNLDTELSRALLEGLAPSPAIAAVLDWGPPEEQVRALRAAAQTGETTQREAALKMLGSWAAHWNCEHGLLKAPERVGTADSLTAWKQWYAQMKRYPLLAIGN